MRIPVVFLMVNMVYKHILMVKNAHSSCVKMSMDHTQQIPARMIVTTKI